MQHDKADGTKVADECYFCIHECVLPPDKLLCEEYESDERKIRLLSKSELYQMFKALYLVK